MDNLKLNRIIHFITVPIPTNKFQTIWVWLSQGWKFMKATWMELELAQPSSSDLESSLRIETTFTQLTPSAYKQDDPSLSAIGMNSIMCPLHLKSQTRRLSQLCKQERECTHTVCCFSAVANKALINMSFIYSLTVIGTFGTHLGFSLPLKGTSKPGQEELGNKPPILQLMDQPLHLLSHNW